MKGAYTAKVADFISGVTYESLPTDVVDHVKLLVLDAIGCGLFGASLPWSDRLRASLTFTETAGRSAVWGAGIGLSAPSAAMANGASVHGFEFDDLGTGGHHGSVTLTSALALAPFTDQLSGRDLIASIVAGIEVAARASNCVGPVPHGELGFHGPGLHGTFGSVASACRALRLNPGQVVDALGHAGQQAASLMFTHHGGMGKRLLAGQAARAGTLGAVLAANGFTNAGTVFEEEYGGYCAAHTGNRTPPAYNLEELIAELGSRYDTRDVSFKMWTCRIPIHSSLEAIRTLRSQNDVPAENVQRIDIKLSKRYFQNVAWPYSPTTVTSAQLNLFYCVAVMMLEDDVGPAQFTEDKIGSPGVLDFIKKIHVEYDSSLDQLPYRDGYPVRITLKNGAVLEQSSKLEPSIVLPRIREDVVKKFRNLTKGCIASATQDKLVDLCARLEDLEDLIPLLDLLGPQVERQRG